MDDKIRLRESIRIDKYDNKEVRAWVDGSFRTELEKSAAWAMFAHLCNGYKGVRELVRGELVSTETQTDVTRI